MHATSLSCSLPPSRSIPLSISESFYPFEIFRVLLPFRLFRMFFPSLYILHRLYPLQASLRRTKAAGPSIPSSSSSSPSSSSSSSFFFFFFFFFVFFLFLFLPLYLLLFVLLFFLLLLHYLFIFKSQSCSFMSFFISAVPSPRFHL